MTTTNEIVLHDEQQDTMQLPVDRVAQIFAESGMFPNAKSAAEVATKLIIGRGLGMNDYDAMAGFHIVQGKVNLAANSMAAAIKRSGKYNYRVTEHSTTVVTIKFFEKWDSSWEEVGESTFTAEDAQRAKLSGDNWRKYPKAMLFARAMSAGYRMYCPDAFGMAPVYVEQHGETEIPRIESVEEPTGEDQYDELKQLVADWEERTGEVIVENMCSHFGAESIDDMKKSQVATAITMMKSKKNKGNKHA